MALKAPGFADTDNMLLRKIASAILVMADPAASVAAGGPDLSRSGSYTKDVLMVPTVSAASAYTAGDAVGGIQTVALYRADGYGSVLNSITVTDAANQKAALSIIFFRSIPGVSTITDNAAFVLAAADIGNICGIVNIAAADWTTVSGKAVVTKSGLGIIVQADFMARAYVAVVTSGTPTYAATDDLVFHYGVIQD